VNYLVLHGTEDGDLSSFHGSRQFERIQFTDNQYWCKATLYIRGANHGQFNTVWGRHDQSGFGARFLNFSGIMPPDAQRQIAKVSISAFLEATLHGQTDYLTLFRTPQAGQKWLPPTVYRNKFQDSTYRFLATYEEDLDLTTTTLPGGSMLGENLSDWRERALEITWGDLDTHAVVLGWNPKESKATPSYALTLPRLEAVTHDDVLVFTLADTNEDETTPKSAAPIEFTLEMVGRGGAVTRTPIALGRQIETNVFKAAFARRVPPSELVFQSFEVPVAVDDLTMVRFVFDKSASGVVALDDVGFRARVPARAHALLP